MIALAMALPSAANDAIYARLPKGLSPQMGMII
jgi:hypothetical protein